MHKHEEIREIDLNPVRVYPRSAAALDARIPARAIIEQDRPLRQIRPGPGMARLTSFLLLIAAVFLLCPAPALPASLMLDASVREVHEDNVNLLLSGAGRPLAQDNSMEPPTAAGSSAAPRRCSLPRRPGQATFRPLRAAVRSATMAGPGLELYAPFRVRAIPVPTVFGARCRDCRHQDRLRRSSSPICSRSRERSYAAGPGMTRTA